MPSRSSPRPNPPCDSGQRSSADRSLSVSTPAAKRGSCAASSCWPPEWRSIRTIRQASGRRRHENLRVDRVGAERVGERQELLPRSGETSNSRRLERWRSPRRRPVAEPRLALGAVETHVSRARRPSQSVLRGRNDVARKDVALSGREIGRDRHIGVRHCAEHRLDGGRVLFHPLQAFACISRRGARRLLGASAVCLSGGRAHGVCEPSPCVLLAGFGRDARLEIGEFRGEQGPPFGARRTVVQRRRISPGTHGGEGPKAGGGKGDDANCCPHSPRG